MIVTLFWCAYTARGTPEYLPITRSWFAAELSMSGQYGGCKQRGQPAMVSLKTLFMPRLAICSRDLHWHWINRTLLCDTMEVSMLSRAWLTIAQHVFQPALTGRPELISRKIVSGEPGTKAIGVSRLRPLCVLAADACLVGWLGIEVEHLYSALKQSINAVPARALSRTNHINAAHLSNSSSWAFQKFMIHICIYIMLLSSSLCVCVVQCVRGPMCT